MRAQLPIRKIDVLVESPFIIFVILMENWELERLQRFARENAANSWEHAVFSSITTFR
jgi:hypothetical protein